MRVIYHSALVSQELVSGSVFHALPVKAYLELQIEAKEQDYDALLNGDIVDINTNFIEIDSGVELIISVQGKKLSYTVKPIVHPLSRKYALSYDQFRYEYNNKTDNEIESIRSGHLKMYAVDQSTEVYDWSDTFKKIEDAFSAFKSICERPKSHLRAINEVRPIETVKRIGYESIPYLAAHSEDWMARTVSGLKPARLFSRVEDDEYQIYENCVVKTLIDLIILFLRKKEKGLKDQYEQLNGIINSYVQTGSFGFDVSFQKAVAELLVSDDKGNEHRSKVLVLVDDLHKQALRLLKKYRTLRRTRLYRYLKKSKAISNPLNETNILLMDKLYSVVFKLWKSIHKIIAPRQIVEGSMVDLKYTYEDYLLFCKALCGYTAHVLNFDIEEDGLYYRQGDNLELTVSESEDLIHMVLRDRTKRYLNILTGLQVPIEQGTSFEGFSFDGRTLFWENTTDDNAIERFCSQFKTRESRGREREEERKRYSAIKQALDQRQREYNLPAKNKSVIFPATVELANDNRNAFREYVKACAVTISKEHDADFVIIALPKCDEDEQKITEYAKYDNEKTLILPLTMFDINSFRRIQNVLLRQIISLNTTRCPACGGELRSHDNRFVCDNCNQIILTKTICPNSQCKHSYYYLSYDTSPDTIIKMQNVDRDNFYLADSLYQYKDIVVMSVENGKIRSVCPHCRNL